MFVVRIPGLETRGGNPDVCPRFGWCSHIALVHDVGGEAIVVKWTRGGNTVVAGICTGVLEGSRPFYCLRKRCFEQCSVWWSKRV